MEASSMKLIWMMMMMMMMVVASSCSSCPRNTCCDATSSNSVTFLHDLHLLCPLPISSTPSPPPPFQMDGDSFERVVKSLSPHVYASVLFYDSRSSFSSGMRSKFDMLGSMFPQISHIAVEQSLMMPSLFSRYGIHSLPALYMVNQATEMRYSGPKDLQSLAHFYKRTTGLDPVECHVQDDSTKTMINELVPELWYQSPWGEIIAKEPYLVFSVLFVVLRAFLYFCPAILSRVTAVWMLCKRQFNLGIFGESSQLLDRVLYLIDVKRVWSKLKICKTRNFQKGARSARVWASSLASVSLGETSARLSSSVES